MKIFPGKPQIEFESWYEWLYPLLCREKSEYIILFESRTLLTHKYVIHVDQDHPVEAKTQLPMRQVGQRVQEEEFVKPKPQTTPEQYPLYTIVPSMILQQNKSQELFETILQTIRTHIEALS